MANKIVRSLGCSSIATILGAVFGTIITILFSLFIFDPLTYDWYQHNASLNNGEWALYNARSHKLRFSP